jgi:hypothetical protein
MEMLWERFEGWHVLEYSNVWTKCPCIVRGNVFVMYIFSCYKAEDQDCLNLSSISLQVFHIV